MLSTRDEFLGQIQNDGVAICGYHIQDHAIHVGLFFKLEEELKVIHFLNGHNIPILNVSEEYFENYFFNQIQDFNIDLIPSLAALAELISQNKLNGFIFNRVGVVYDGGKFEYIDGSYTGKTAPEKYVNCAVFTIALLQTFDYTLLDWGSWPNANPANRIFLEEWLESNHVPVAEREPFYNQTKEVRGKHVIVCPSTETKPSPYNEASPLAEALIAELTVV